MSAHKPDSLAIVDMAGEGFVTNFTDADLKYIALERAKMRGRLFSMERSTPLTIRRLAAIEEALCHRLAGEIEDEGTEYFDYEGALEEIISDSLEMDWRPRDAARAIIAQFEKENSDG